LTRLGVLVSGRGSNLQAILKACADGSVDGTVVLVAGNRECPALEIARAAGVGEVRAFAISEYGSSAARDGAMTRALRSASVELVVCAGYDRLLDDVLVRAFEGAIINVHPSLLPEFAGTMQAIREAFEAGVMETGVTVHLIEPGTIDAGTILAQQRVPVEAGDSLRTLEARVHAAEHRLLPATIQAVIEGKLVRQA
jgi:phosphoribosylglycinamide formyltransferase 1